MMNEFERQWNALTQAEKRRTALVVAGLLAVFFIALLA
jgi:hypothetical protein